MNDVSNENDLVEVGRVVRFDHESGYGFIDADDADEDVFFHANDCRSNKALYVPGADVSFEIVEGDKGLRAVNVEVTGDDLAMTTDYFETLVTNALIERVPDMTGAQIDRARKAIVALAQDQHLLA